MINDSDLNLKFNILIFLLGLFLITLAEHDIQMRSAKFSVFFWHYSIKKV